MYARVNQFWDCKYNMVDAKVITKADSEVLISKYSDRKVLSDNFIHEVVDNRGNNMGLKARVYHLEDTQITFACLVM